MTEKLNQLYCSLPKYEDSFRSLICSTLLSLVEISIRRESLSENDK